MDKYQRIKKIGEGSFGKALLVKNKENGKQMVVKEINMARMSGKERTEARKEVAVLAQLSHPNIVTYKESFEEVGNLYIVMDYCDGGDLYSRINAQRGTLFQENQILDWFVQVCLSIKHIHDRKILHRDIKSQNIFLTRHGLVKLGDFGIAKVLNSTVELAKTCIGTPYYLSPEICENKPYNNKSDVWSLGCVLYELTTLKHAFESGNMKNLVLKIIRGSYPPVPPKYSYELRSLIAKLFKRSPRDRPSINAILRQSLLQNRIRKFLTDSEMADEFSHTVIHGGQIKKAIPVNKPRPLPAKRPPSASKTPRYNPAAVYGQPVRNANRQSKERENRRSSDGRKPVAGPTPAEMARKRQELMERERQRREQAKKKEQQVSASRHKELVEKQRLARINKAREEGWKGLIDSLGSDDSDNKGPSKKEEKKVERAVPIAKPASPSPSNQNVPLCERGNYEQYHSWLDDMEQKRQANRATPIPANKPAEARAGFNPALAAKQGQAAGVQGAQAAERAKVVAEFLNRKQEAAANRARGQANLMGHVGAGGVRGAISPRVAPSPRVNAAAAPGAGQDDKGKGEEEYLARLKQIRLQNFNERRMQKDKVSGKNSDKYKPAPKDDDIRRKKIEALRQQADERARKLKEQLEQKRKEMAELERKRQQQVQRPLAAKFDRAVPVSKPSVPVKPSVPMTEAMKAIGAGPQPVKPNIGMTAAMQAIGAGATPEKSAGEPQRAAKPALPEEPQVSTKSPLEQKKAAILKKLNANLAKPPGANGRPKWDTPAAPAASVDRPKWGDEKAAVPVLKDLPLEQTASQMEATGAGDVVVSYREEPPVTTPEEAPGPSSRRQWGSPSTTVFNVLQAAPPCETTTSDEGSSLGGTITKEGPEEKEAGKADAKEAWSDNKDVKDEEKLEVPPKPRSRSTSPKPALKEEATSAGNEQVTPLFDRVALDETEAPKASQDLVVQEMDEETPRPSPGKTEKVLSVGLSTGHFDADVKMLRTCSEPDLNKLFRTTLKENPFFSDEEKLSASMEEMQTVAEDEEEQEDAEEEVEELQQVLSQQLDEEDTVCHSEDEEKPSKESEAGSGPEVKQESEVRSAGSKEAQVVEEKEENTATTGDTGEEGETSEDAGGTSGDALDPAEDDEDMETLRESMMSLLQSSDPTDDLAAITKKKGKKKKTKGKKKKPKVREVPEQEEQQADSPQSIRGLSLRSNQSEEDLHTMMETMKSVLVDAVKTCGSGRSTKNARILLEGTPELGPSGDGGEAGPRVVDSIETTLLPGKEAWQSDSDKEDDYFEDEDDMFSRLEESRARLEEQLGEQTFLKAYKTVQAIHEDEDENMEEGVALISSILGEHQDLYPSILQLVMADGAFMEDND